MKKCLLALASLLVAAACAHAQYANAVLSYDTGTGFASGYTVTSSALGAPALGSSVDPMTPPFAKTQLISIGAGGQITLQLDTPITNDLSHPFGSDFIIFANSFFVASGGSGQNKTTSGSLFFHAATTSIQVSLDATTWFTLNPSLAPAPGQWFPSYGGGNPLIPVDPSLTTTNYAGQTLGQIETLYAGSAGGTGYDLAWAQDGNANNANLTSASYVRIQVQSGVVDMDAISVVPEPSALFLVSLGVLSLVFWRRKLMC